MTSKLVSLVVVASMAIVVTVAQVGGAARQPDCSAIIAKVPFDQYKHVCKALEDNSVEQLLAFSITNRLDIIETCACNILNHELAWASIMTQEAEALYLAIEQFIADSDRDAPNPELNATNPVFRLYSDGARMYKWDRITDLLRRPKSDKEKAELTHRILKYFADLYYDPESFEFRFKDMPPGTALYRLISDTCNSLRAKTGTFLVYLNKLRQLAENDRFVFKIAAYNDDLHKIRMNINLCTFLAESKQLIS